MRCSIGTLGPAPVGDTSGSSPQYHHFANPRNDVVCRHRLYDKTFQCTVHAPDIDKLDTLHMLRHCFATHPRQAESDSTIQE